MDEKIVILRWVMHHAKDRGIQFLVFAWNISVYGTEPSGYGITDSPANATRTDYSRKSVRTLFNTYLRLAGIGLGTGENMGPISGEAQEQWAGGGTLQTATNVLGFWCDVPGAASPYLHSATNAAQFFRIKQ